MIRCSERSPIAWLWNMHRFAVALNAILLFSSASINFALPFSRIAGSQQDNRITAAQKAFAEGQQLLAEGTAVSQRNAIEKFAEAATLWRAVDDKRREAIALSLIGKIYDLLSEKQKALDYYTQTLSLVRTVGDRSSEAATLNNIGLIYDSLGEKQKALVYYQTALSILQETGN